ncbi:FAD-binding oxidoreductase [Paenibacillus sp. N3.4]|uniref:NAD(P)/FAD-dependent oxidoreductase n=1 Tax=Paenibacillus sp. N3.4 TaxID=2603222 RepID=UPI0011C9E30F|nr:FAD-dependent oxidoreductase [Paenibacillus sp. N3.4]TXK85950.1 FAD-binding oxidoreductase [Paenibacillus sp. N3.4]
MNVRAHSEVVVIGGGIIGSAIAYYTAKAGISVTVIERGDLVSGTSSRCDGNILAIDKDLGFDSQMSLISQELVTELNKELQIPFEYRRTGSILVCESEEEMEAAEKWVRQQTEAGLPFRMLDRSDIKQESAYFADDLLGGLECATDSTINSYMLSYSLIDGAERYGAQIVTKAEVTSVNRDIATGQWGIGTSEGTFTAKKVVNAAGVWAPTIGRLVGIEIPIVPRKGHLIVASRQMPVMVRNVMEFGYLLSKFGGKRKVDQETEKYGVAMVLEPTESQNFLVGSSRQFVNFNTKVDLDVVRCIARRAIRFYPKLADMTIIRTYAGLRPWTEDHLPIVCQVEALPGFFIAAGHEGDGISLAAVTGKLISELLTEQEQTIIPTEPLRLDRFRKTEECRQHDAS